MRFWLVAGGLLLIVAVVLPVAGITHTLLGDAQSVFALALVVLLWRRVQILWPEPPAPAPTPR